MANYDLPLHPFASRITTGCSAAPPPPKTRFYLVMAVGHLDLLYCFIISLFLARAAQWMMLMMMVAVQREKNNRKNIIQPNVNTFGATCSATACTVGPMDEEIERSRALHNVTYSTKQH